VGNLFISRRRARCIDAREVASWMGTAAALLDPADSLRAPQLSMIFEIAAGWLAAGPFDRFLGGRVVDVPALGAFENPQIRTIATGFDAGQHHATPARRAQWQQHRNQRWLETRISFGHVILLLIGGACCAPPIATGTAATMEQA